MTTGVVPICCAVALVRGHHTPDLNHELLVRQGIVSSDSQLIDGERQVTASKMMYQDGLAIQFEAHQLSLSLNVYRDGKGPDISHFEKLSKVALQCVAVFFSKTQIESVVMAFDFAREDLPYSKIAAQFNDKLPKHHNQPACLGELAWHYKWPDNKPAKGLSIQASEGQKKGSAPGSVSLFTAKAQFSDFESHDTLKSVIAQKSLQQEFEWSRKIIGGWQ